jgi:aerobic carbon-monoxide dehydrogenase medium subunit
MGTVGGNVANGDPGNDMPGLMQCLDATFTLVGPDGTRDVAARDFYQAAYVTERADRRDPDADQFRARPPAATPTKSRSARSATMPPPPPPCC